MRTVAAAATERAGQNIQSPSKGCTMQARLQLTCINFFDEQMFVENLLLVETRGLGECPATGQYDRWRKGT